MIDKIDPKIIASVIKLIQDNLGKSVFITFKMSEDLLMKTRK